MAIKYKPDLYAKRNLPQWEGLAVLCHSPAGRNSKSIKHFTHIFIGGLLNISDIYSGFIRIGVFLFVSVRHSLLRQSWCVRKFMAMVCVMVFCGRFISALFHFCYLLQCLIKSGGFLFISFDTAGHLVYDDMRYTSSSIINPVSLPNLKNDRSLHILLSLASLLLGVSQGLLLPIWTTSPCSHY